MWSPIVPIDLESPAPSARSKHSATVVGENVYLLGGRNGNLPVKDFWKYNIATGMWQLLKPNGDQLPLLQEHSAVAYKNSIYVFGGEVGFSAGSETPLWCYEIAKNYWRKLRSNKDVATPKGRRGHSALVYTGSMFIYGGYQDLRGSCNELWAFHFETESWHLLSMPTTKKNQNLDTFPPPRHKHSAIIHENAMWIYGGMTDLQERGDLWKWDAVLKTWSSIKTKLNPGPLHSHAVCKLPSSMLIFGGERSGHPVNELWNFNFNVELWEKITISGIKPQPRSESIALVVSESVLKDSSALSESKSFRLRSRTCNSADRSNRHPCLPNNRVVPYEKTYVFQPSQENYTDGSDIIQHYSETKCSRSILQELTKISQIKKLNNKCSYTVLTGCKTDSTESLLKQYISPPNNDNINETEFVAPSKMVKSKSAYVIKKKFQAETEKLEEVSKEPCNVKLPHEPISAPNISILTLSSSSLTPVEATKLIYLDTDEENDVLNNGGSYNIRIVKNSSPSTANEYYNFVKKGESYNSHLGYADNPLYNHMMKMNDSLEKENVSSTSDYASIETVNHLSSSSNYSVTIKTNQNDIEKNHRNNDEEGPFGFCNPNYMGPEINNLINSNNQKEEKDKKKFLTHQYSKLDGTGECVELQDCSRTIDKTTKVYFRNSHRCSSPKSLESKHTVQPAKESKSRSHSASRAEHSRRARVENNVDKNIDLLVPINVLIIGGKEQGQVTVFKRPISIWKLTLC